MHLSSSVLALLSCASLAVGQHKGTPYGFARGVTGGGSATPSYPKDVAQYVASPTQL